MTVNVINDMGNLSQKHELGAGTSGAALLIPFLHFFSSSFLIFSIQNCQVVGLDTPPWV